MNYPQAQQIATEYAKPGFTLNDLAADAVKYGWTEGYYRQVLARQSSERAAALEAGHQGMSGAQAGIASGEIKTSPDAAGANDLSPEDALARLWNSDKRSTMTSEQKIRLGLRGE